MNCREFVEFLMAYLEGELAARQQSTFEEHMIDCPGCKTYLETYEDTIRLGKLACEEQDDLPDDVPEALVAAILAARESG